jgi:hypothetical protein
MSQPLYERVTCQSCAAAFAYSNQAFKEVGALLCPACLFAVSPDSDIKAAAASYGVSEFQLSLLQACVAQRHPRADHGDLYGSLHDRPCIDCQLNSFHGPDSDWSPFLQRNLEIMSGNYGLPVWDLAERLDILSKGEARLISGR